ncbi:hypothetical protein KKE06_00750 [Candidatus Micrarchaeota archaeon]|nr:hypothetical protein [Candidatus Micrarchaeota archaeon]MBU1930135.1 hypothetical protein [Candidatus Micrarchaeota archaeon]
MPAGIATRRPTKRKDHNPFIKAGKTVFKEASKLAREQRQENASARVRESDPEQQKIELRMKRLNKWLRNMAAKNPERAAEAQEFIQKAAQTIERGRGQGYSNTQLEGFIRPPLQELLERYYPNQKRYRQEMETIVIRALFSE